MVNQSNWFDLSGLIFYISDSIYCKVFREWRISERYHYTQYTVHKPGPVKSMHQWPVGQFKQCLDFDEEKIQINEC